MVDDKSHSIHADRVVERHTHQPLRPGEGLIVEGLGIRVDLALGGEHGG